MMIWVKFMMFKNRGTFAKYVEQIFKNELLDGMINGLESYKDFLGGR